MYPPFEFNNWLGPLIALSFFGTATTLITVLALAKDYFRREEDSYHNG